MTLQEIFDTLIKGSLCTATRKRSKKYSTTFYKTPDFQAIVTIDKETAEPVYIGLYSPKETIKNAL